LFFSIKLNRQKVKIPQKVSDQEIGKKKLRPLPFCQILGNFFVVEFLTFDSWNCLGVTKNNVYHRWLLISSTYRIKICSIKCTPFPPASRPRAVPSSGPLKSTYLASFIATPLCDNGESFCASCDA